MQNFYEYISESANDIKARSFTKKEDSSAMLEAMKNFYHVVDFKDLSSKVQDEISNLAIVNKVSKEKDIFNVVQSIIKLGAYLNHNIASMTNALKNLNGLTVIEAIKAKKVSQRLQLELEYVEKNTKLSDKKKIREKEKILEAVKDLYDNYFNSLKHKSFVIEEQDKYFKVKYVPGSNPEKFSRFEHSFEKYTYAAKGIESLMNANPTDKNYIELNNLAKYTLDRISKAFNIDLTKANSRNLVEVPLDFDFSFLIKEENMNQGQFNIINSRVPSKYVDRFKNNWSVLVSLRNTETGTQFTNDLAKLCAIEIFTLPIIKISKEAARYLTQAKDINSIKLTSLNSWVSHWDSNHDKKTEDIHVTNSLVDNFYFSQKKEELGVKTQQTRSDPNSKLFVNFEGRFCYAPSTNDVDDSNVIEYEKIYEEFIRECAKYNEPVSLLADAATSHLENKQIFNSVLNLKDKLIAFNSVPLISNWDLNISACVNTNDPTELKQVNLMGGTKPTVISLGEILNDPINGGLRALLSKIEEKEEYISFSSQRDISNLAIKHKLATIFAFFRIINKVMDVEYYLNNSHKAIHQNHILDDTDFEYGIYKKFDRDLGKFISDDCLKFGENATNDPNVKFIIDNDLSDTSKFGISVADLKGNQIDFVKEYNKFCALFDLWALIFDISKSNYLLDWEKSRFTGNIEDFSVDASPYWMDSDNGKVKNIGSLSSSYIVAQAFSRICNSLLAKITRPKNELFSHSSASVKPVFNNRPALPNFKEICEQVVPFLSAFGYLILKSDEIIKEANKEKEKFKTNPNAIPRALPGKNADFRFLIHQVHKAESVLQNEPRVVFLDVSPGGGKCLTGDSLVPTSSGLLSLFELWQSTNSSIVDGFKDLSVEVSTTNGIKETNKVYNTKGETVRINLADGTVIEGLPPHRMLGLVNDGIDFITLEKTKVGDYLPKSVGTRLFNSEIPTFKSFDIEQYHINSTSHFVENNLKVPKQLSIELSLLFGFLVAEGYYPKDYSIVKFTNHNSEVMDLYCHIYKKSFGSEPVMSKDGFDATTSNAIIIDFIRSVLKPGKSADKEVPMCIRTAPEKFQLAFLQALFEGDGSCYRETAVPRWSIEYCTISKVLAYQVKAMLENIGIYVTVRNKKTWCNNGSENQVRKTAYILEIVQQSYELFSEKIGFISEAKQQKLADCLKHQDWLMHGSNQSSNYYVHGYYNQVPCGDALEKLMRRVEEIAATITYQVPTTSKGAGGRTENYSMAWLWRNIGFNKNNNYGYNKDNITTRHNIDKCLALINNAPAQVKEKIHNDAICKQYWKIVKNIKDKVWVKVVKTKKLNKVKQVYDLSVPGPHTYSVNGFMGHNTIIGLTDCIALMSQGKVKRPLIIAPNSILKNWITEINESITDKKFNTIPIVADTVCGWKEEKMAQMIKEAPPNTIYLTDMNFVRAHSKKITLRFMNFERTVYANLEWMKQFEFDYILIDEVHYLKNASGAKGGSARSRLIAELTLNPEVKYIRLASGTIITNDVDDIIGQTRLVDPSIFRTEKDFYEMYANPENGGWTPEAAYMIRERLSKYCGVVRAKRKDWAQALPTLIENHPNTWIVEMDEEFKKVYDHVCATTFEEMQKDPALKAKLQKRKNLTEDDALEEILDEEAEADEEGDEESMGAIFKVYLDRLEQFLVAPEADKANGWEGWDFSRLNAPKMPRLIELLDEHFSDKSQKVGKVIIFVRHIAAVFGIYNRLPEHYKQMSVTYHGSAKNSLNNFLFDPDVKIIIGTETSMNTGLNLQIASRIIRMELCWTPGEIEQGISRIFRPDAENKYERQKIFSDYILVDDSLDIPKMCKLITKTIRKVKFDEYKSSNPGYASLPDDLDPVKMSLKKFLNPNTAIRRADQVQNYFNAYHQLTEVQSAEFLKERAKYVDPNGKLLKQTWIDVDETDMMEGSVNIEFTPIIGDQNYVPDRHDDGLVPLKEWIADNKEYVEDPEKFVDGNPVFVYTEVGYGYIYQQPRLSKDKNSISSVTILTSYGELIRSIPANSVFVATNLKNMNQKLRYIGVNAIKDRKGKIDKTHKHYNLIMNKYKGMCPLDQTGLIYLDEDNNYKVYNREGYASLNPTKIKPTQIQVLNPSEKDNSFVPQNTADEEDYKLKASVWSINNLLVIAFNANDPDSKELEALGYDKVGNFIAIKIRNKTEFEKLLSHIIEKKYVLSEVDIKALEELKARFNNKTKLFNGTFGNQNNNFKAYFIKDNPNPNKKGLSIKPLVEDGELYMVVKVKNNPTPARELLANPSIEGIKGKFKAYTKTYVKSFNNKTSAIRSLNEINNRVAKIVNYNEVIEKIKELTKSK